MDFSKILNSVYNFVLKKYNTKKNRNIPENDKTTIFTDTALEYSDCKPFLPLVAGSVVYVCKVYDGDTCTLSFLNVLGEPVRISCRINGIDTPELRGSEPAEKELALLAKDRLSMAVLGEFVTVLEPGTEKYGRVLCNLKTDNLGSVSDYMLADPSICKPYDGGTKVKWV